MFDGCNDGHCVTTVQTLFVYSQGVIVPMGIASFQGISAEAHLTIVIILNKEKQKQ